MKAKVQSQPFKRYDAIVFYCIECHCGVRKEVRTCQATDCLLYPYRLGGKTIQGYTGELFSRAKAIREFCTDCFCGATKLKKSCSDNSCFLYPYRFGTSEADGYEKQTLRQRITYEK